MKGTREPAKMNPKRTVILIACILSLFVIYEIPKIANQHADEFNQTTHRFTSDDALILWEYSRDAADGTRCITLTTEELKAYYANLNVKMTPFGSYLIKQNDICE